MMKIGEAAERSNLPAETIRYYESIELLKPERSESGYRNYSEDNVRVLKFLYRCRGLGFSISECKSLLLISGKDNYSSDELEKIAAQHLHSIDQKMTELQALKSELYRAVRTAN